MQITTRPITDLVPYANNARTHSTAQVSGLAGTIGAIRWTSPVLYDDAGIIAGHGRVMAAQRIYDQGGTILGPDGEALPPGTVPAIYMPGLSEAERKALILADNKHADKAGWDEELLRLELDDLQGLDFDLELTGFDIKELDALLKDEWIDPAEETATTNPLVTITIRVAELRANELKREVASVCSRYNAKVV